MRRLCGFLVAVLAGVALPAMALAAQAGDTKAKPAAPSTKTVSAIGTVSAVSTESLTVKSKTAEWTFVIDSKTSVTAKGATHKTLALKAEDKKPRLTDFVKVGDAVTVSYQDMGATKRAATIRVTTQTK